MASNQPIGVFDSGIGGLSVLKQFIRFLPFEKYIYLGDTARVPYGNKSPEIVKQYSAECTEFLMNKGVKIIIVACNTASSVALHIVKQIAGDIPVIGMILPAASAALRGTINGKIGVIGTRATISSGAYSNIIYELANEKKIEVFSQACPLFVPIVEEGLTRHPAARLISEDYLDIFKEHGIDTLVLGCTHYPILAQLISDILPQVTLIDSGEHASVTALRLLAEMNKLVDERQEFIEKPDIEFYVTDVPSMFYELANQFLGFPVDSPKKVSLENI
jgi:glutamate racemase